MYDVHRTIAESERARSAPVFLFMGIARARARHAKHTGQSLVLCACPFVHFSSFLVVACFSRCAFLINCFWPHHEHKNTRRKTKRPTTAAKTKQHAVGYWDWILCAVERAHACKSIVRLRKSHSAHTARQTLSLEWLVVRECTFTSLHLVDRFWHGSGTSVCLSFVDLLMSVFDRDARCNFIHSYLRPALSWPRAASELDSELFILIIVQPRRKKTPKEMKKRKPISGRIMQ